MSQANLDTAALPGGVAVGPDRAVCHSPGPAPHLGVALRLSLIHI